MIVGRRSFPFGISYIFRAELLNFQGVYNQPGLNHWEKTEFSEFLWVFFVAKLPFGLRQFLGAFVSWGVTHWLPGAARPGRVWRGAHWSKVYCKPDYSGIGVRQLGIFETNTNLFAMAFICQYIILGVCFVWTTLFLFAWKKHSERSWRPKKNRLVKWFDSSYPLAKVWYTMRRGENAPAQRHWKLGRPKMGWS